MLTTTITSLADQDVADAMRRIAQRMQCSLALTETAVDEAVRTFQDGETKGEALNAGVRFIQRARSGWVPRRRDPVEPIDHAIEMFPSFRRDPAAAAVFWATVTILGAIIAWGFLT